MSSRLPLGKNELAVGELPKESPYAILSAKQDAGLTSAAATNGGPYEGRIVVSEGKNESVLFGGGERFNNIQPVIAVYCWQRTA